MPVSLLSPGDYFGTFFSSSTSFVVNFVCFFVCYRFTIIFLNLYCPIFTYINLVHGTLIFFFFWQTFFTQTHNIGEKSLLMHHRNAVSVVASENCDTRVLEKMDFEDLCIGKREREIN